MPSSAAESKNVVPNGARPPCVTQPVALDRLHSISTVSSTTDLNELIRSKSEQELIVKKSCAANYNKPLSTPDCGEK